MSWPVRAIFENGIFRPVDPVPPMPDGALVELTIQGPLLQRREGEPAPRTRKEMRELIQSKNPNAEPIPEQYWEELDRAWQRALSNVRDPEVMRQAAERMDRLREQIYKREGLLDIAVPFLRESRDEE